MIARRTLTVLLPFLLLLPSLEMAQAEEKRAPLDRPNLVVLFCDDAGYGDFGFTGHPTIRTPHLDRMKAEGMAFSQFYAASPACTASRYGLLTGRHPSRSGFGWVTYPKTRRGLHSKEITIAETLRTRGYVTALYGKWHLGFPNENNGHDVGMLPLAHGFDEFFGTPYSNDMLPPKWPPLPLLHGPVESAEGDLPGYEVVATNPDQRRFTAQLTRRATQFIRAAGDRPFFVVLAWPMPHIPLHPGEAFVGRSRRGTYGDVIEEIDWSAGEILQTLRDEGLAENTLVVFTSDNGPWITKCERGGSSGPFRDGKGSTWEGGMRVPGLFWWPGRVPAASVCPEVASTLDLLPTATLLAGGELPTDRSLDGKDLRPLLFQEGSAIAKPIFYGGPSRSAVQAVREGPWKLHIRTNSQTGDDHGWPNVSRESPLLFHLEHDPSERFEVSADHPEVVARLLKTITQFEAQSKEEGTLHPP